MSVTFQKFPVLMTISIVILFVVFTTYYSDFHPTDFQQPRMPEQQDDESSIITIPESIESTDSFTTTTTTTSKKWIVVTSISLPTLQIAKLSQIPGWQLVLVADKKTPTSWSHPGVVFLDIETQSKLGYRILNYLPWNSYTRKMIGYLYAIEHGAEVIYDTDDDNAPDNAEDFEKNFDFSTPTTQGLTLNLGDGRDLVENPYAHFGQPSIWPRGYPLELIGKPYNNSYTLCSKIQTPLIQQGLVNGDPDVDAIFRLTRKNLYSTLNVEFDGFAPPLIFPRFLAAPFNSQNTVFHYDAFWALMLPISVSFRVTDIWRGYWAQPLLWKIGGLLGFYSPHTTQLRNAHNYLRDFEEEDQLYKQSGVLVQQLRDWNCSSKDFYTCMVALTQDMAEWKMWPYEEVEFVVAWISDLKRIGYKKPVFLPENATTTKSSSPCSVGSLKNYAVFSGVEIQSKNQLDRRPPCPERYFLKKFCNFSLTEEFSKNLNISQSLADEEDQDNDETTVNSSTPPAPTPDNSSTISQAPLIFFPQHLLVVTFNFPIYENIWLLDLIYRPHFPNILYCGEIKNPALIPNLLSSKAFTESGVTRFSIVHANVKKGYFAYECALRAIEMNYSGISGYIVLSDDVLLNFWNHGKLNPEQIWSSVPLRGFIDTDDPHYKKSDAVKQWGRWVGSTGVPAVRKALKIIYDPENRNPALDQFCKNRANFGWNSSIAMHGASDAFYLPTKLQQVFYEVGRVMRKSEVFLEVAVPLLTSGLSSVQNLTVLRVSYIWDMEKRKKPFQYFNASSNLIHPVKPTYVIKNAALRNQYCSKYVRKVLSLPYA